MNMYCSISSLSCSRIMKTLTSCKSPYKLQDFSINKDFFWLVVVFVGFFFRICINGLTDCKIFLLSKILFSFPIWVSLSLIHSVGVHCVVAWGCFCFFFFLLSHFSNLKALILCIYLFLMKAKILMLPNEYWS